MKKTNLKGKLSLNRETLHTLQPDVLDDVHGGNVVRLTVQATRTIIQASKNYCKPVSAALCTTVTTVASHPAITCRNGN